MDPLAFKKSYGDAFFQVAHELMGAGNRRMSEVTLLVAYLYYKDAEDLEGMANVRQALPRERLGVVDSLADEVNAAIRGLIDSPQIQRKIANLPEYDAVANLKQGIIETLQKLGVN